MKCPICGKELFGISPSHTKKHGLTTQQFLEKYPEFRQINFNYKHVGPYEPVNTVITLKHEKDLRKKGLIP